MKISTLPAVALLGLVATTTAAPATTSASDALSELNALTSQIKESQLEALEAANEKLKKRGVQPTCHLGNIAIRREYGSLSKAERLDYVNAVKCLQKKPSKTPASVASGAKSRFDDFIVTHIQQTFSIHYTGNFLAWHRWFVHIYEKALREECGYKGYAPYWDWPKYADAPEKSPIFNGDAYSLGDKGKYVYHNGTLLVPPPGLVGDPVWLPSGLGGGCQEKGPFVDMKVNLGPVGLADSVPGPEGGLGYNPRCLKRDVGPAQTQRYCNAGTILHLLLANKNITAFRDELEGRPFTYNIGPHGGGHFAINGDPGGDLFTSPGDPAFYLHHGQVDRMWALWQALDPSTRQNALSGTNTWLNEPPSPATTLNDVVDLGYAGPSIRIGDIMSTFSGPLCYIYI